MMRATLIGSARLATRLRRLPEERRRRITAAVQQAGRNLRSSILDSLRSGPTVGSAGEERPRSRSGLLASSIVVVADKRGLATMIGSALDYGRYLEFGTRRMTARPWLLPAFLQRKASLTRLIIEAARGRRS